MKNEISEISEISNNQVSCDSMDYRGIHIDFYDDSFGHQMYCIWEGQPIGFGNFNTQYKEDMKLIIDDHLDTIERFKKEYFGARLQWFKNGDYRDIRLIYKGRLIKIYLVADETQIDLKTILADSKKILDKIIQIMQE